MNFKLSNLDHVSVWAKAVGAFVAAFAAAWGLTGNAVQRDALVGAGTAGLMAAGGYLLQVVRG